MSQNVSQNVQTIIDHTNRILFAAASSVISLVTIIGNILIITAFVQVRSLKRKPSNVLILALSITDLLFGIYEYMFYALPYYFYHGNPFDQTGCILNTALNELFMIGNLLLVAISIDRVLLVSLPYPKYTKTLTLFRVRMTILACYSIGLVAAIIEVGLWDYALRKQASAAEINFKMFCKSPTRRLKWFASVFFVALTLVPVLLIGILSAIFFCLLRRRIRKDRRVGDFPYMSSSTQFEISTVSSVGPLFHTNRSLLRGEAPEETRIKNRYIKPAVTLFALVAAMGISMFPLCSLMVVRVFSKHFSDGVPLTIASLIAQLNPLLDPLFYGATQKNVKELYKRKYDKLKKWWKA